MGTTATVHRRKLPRTGDSGATKISSATSGSFYAGAGNFAPDPVIARLAKRAAHPLAAPSWKSFRMYATTHPDIAELRQVGLRSMMQAHQGLRFAVIAVVASVMLLLAALLAYWWLVPATADADSPYATAEVSSPESTPARAWKRGTIPSLYQADAQWAAQPFGQATIGAAGAAPTALAMTYVALTGDQALTPTEFAAWGTAHDLTATGAETIDAFLTQAADEYGLTLQPLTMDEHDIRRALVSRTPVLVVTQPGTFAPVASVIVLDDIDRDSRLVIHDPASASRSAKSWQFDDIINASAAAYEVHPA